MTQTPTHLDAKPCPFCAGTDIRFDAHQHAGTGMHSGETVYSMCCYNCGATFPNRYRKEILVECWNRRAYLASQEAAAPSEEPVASQGEAYWLRKNAVLVRELGSSMSPGALAAAMERRADTLDANGRAVQS